MRQLTDADASFGSERFQYDDARNLAGASPSINLAEQATNYGRTFDEAFRSMVPTAKPTRWQTTASGVVQTARGPRAKAFNSPMMIAAADREKSRVLRISSAALALPLGMSMTAWSA